MKEKNVIIAFLLLFGIVINAGASSLKKEYTNSIGMVFVEIPAGTFIMGSPESEPARDDDERQHQVVLTKSFYLQTTEVTQNQWQAVMGDNPSLHKECGPDCPVERVSFADVQKFISKLSTLSGQRYRLPTEAEFEYAARAGSTGAYANGDITETPSLNEPLLDAMGWYCFNAGESTHPVAQKQANAWGLYDMHGNVWEWCADTREAGDYPPGQVTDPVSVNPGENRVVRGGSWYHDAWAARSANRDWIKPHYYNDFLGFRVVLEKD